MHPISCALAATLLAGATSLTQATPIISPFAADLAAGNCSADSAAGGSSAQSVFNGGYWNAGGHGNHWVQADMGASFTLSQVRFAVDVLPANGTTQLVFLSDTPIGNLWSTLTAVASRSGYTTKYQQFEVDFASAASGRYLQIVSNGGASWTALGDEFARSNWVDPAVQGGGGAAGGNVPEPGSWALAALALVVLGWQHRADGAARLAAFQSN